MRRDAFPPVVAIWSFGYLGCLAFLLLGSRPPASLAFLAQLAWLALIGSIPTALLLGSAIRVRNAPRAIPIAVALAIGLLGLFIGWRHADFLLSGPRWALHPHRGVARVVLAFGFATLAAAGWGWLVAGARAERRAHRVTWVLLTLVAIALSWITISRYRAYDYTTAQLVFPGGVLVGALIAVVARDSVATFRFAIIIAALWSISAVGSRLSSGSVATAEREVLAHSRTGALVSLYILPHVGVSRTWSDSSIECPAPELYIDTMALPMSADERRNVILISVDALRKDFIGETHEGRPLTPRLSELALRGVSFQNATTTYPATLFAIGSAFTGLTPAELYLSPAMPETIFTRVLGEVDQRFIVLPDVSWFRLPIVRDFLAPGVEARYAATDATATKMMIERLEAARDVGDSVMAWIHYYAPHDPYRSHPSFPFGRGRKNAYRSEVAYFDAQLGTLLDYLEEAGWARDSLIVFFSDHGEALGEGGYYGHHVYLDGWMIDVPLVLWHARLRPAQPTVGVSIADVAPTVMHFLGLPRPADLTAESLFVLESNTAARPSFSEAFPVRGEALFDSFRLPSLDDATIQERLRTIRTASKGYEPKGAITKPDARLIHHRSADVALLYRREKDGAQTALRSRETAGELESLENELEQWENQQQRRIQCRLRLSAPP